MNDSSLHANSTSIHRVIAFMGLPNFRALDVQMPCLLSFVSFSAKIIEEELQRCAAQGILGRRRTWVIK